MDSITKIEECQIRADNFFVLIIFLLSFWKLSNKCLLSIIRQIIHLKHILSISKS